MITRDLNNMVAVASGSKTQVGRWANCLKRAAIEYVVAEPFGPEAADPDFRAEVWVAEEDADEARVILQRSTVKGDSNLW